MGAMRHVAGDSVLDAVEIGDRTDPNLAPGARRPRAPFPKLCAHELIEAQALRYPDRLAIDSDRVALDYRALNERGERIAEVLRGLGVGRGSRVGLCARPSPGAIAAILGTWKAGGVYVPFHPEQPAARLERQWTAAKAVCCLADEEAAARFSFSGTESIRLADSRFDSPASRGEVSAPPPDPDDLAYAIFTSGSTGEPKLVGVRHSSLVNYTLWVWQELLGGEEGLRFATPSSLAADLGHTAIFPALASAGTLAIAPPAASRDAEQFAEFMETHTVDVLKIVPSHLAALWSGAGPRVLPRRILVSGGEALTWDLARRVSESGSCRIVNHYGPTETTVGALTYEVDATLPDDGIVPIGRPIANTRAYVLDEGLRPLPAGRTGELWIAGEGVAVGYLGNPESTASRFLDDPFSSAGGKMYRTGDRARLRLDGVVEFLGRLDDQLKIRGNRVEPGETWAALRRHPAVAEAAVAGVPDPSGERVLVAYVSPREGSAVTRSKLRRFLSSELAEPAIPSRFVFVESFPITPSGKVDLARLSEAAAFPPPRVAPRNAVEEWIAGVWKDVLGITDVGVDEDFFELGGHSLLATRVMARLRRELSVSLPLPTLFRHRTVAELAVAVAGACRTAPVRASAGEAR